MKTVKLLIAGIVFGIILTKAEVISWYRIYEMFKFQSFHMYGVIGSAVILGALGIWVIKKKRIRDEDGNPIQMAPKDRGWKRYLFGGTIFGLGWALSGACPGPIYALIGYGFGVVGLVLLGALLGTFVYGLIKNKLPH